MFSLIRNFLGGAWGYLVAAGGILLALLTALGIARRSGEKEEQNAATEKSLQQSKESNDIAQANRNLSDAAARDKLRSVQRD